MNLDYVIRPVSRELIKSELSDNNFVRDTNKGENEISTPYWYDEQLKKA